MYELNLAQVIVGVVIGGVFTLVATVIGVGKGYGTDGQSAYYRTVLIIGTFVTIVWVLAHSKRGPENDERVAEPAPAGDVLKAAPEE